MMKVPYFAERSPIPVDNCSEHCLNNCSCIAYAFDAAIGCMTWTGSLIDIKKFPVGGSDLYIRLARSELEKKDNKVVVIVPVVAGIITCTICTFFLWRSGDIQSMLSIGISRCIHVGLLCVQEFVKDRPTMSTVISMLNSEIVDLPTPKQPAFTERRNAGEESFEQIRKGCSLTMSPLLPLRSIARKFLSHRLASLELIKENSTLE
ncbi:hypothetical protein LWI29_038202 [Acer saccharum]|uniref:Apple domain-containing protein n=1 Tax=Acer saccharum TaxID=4024 RepID=A0AA39RUA3_ACESA|nr:hypothetical protein LWI29_038202 [Acer saccharum]